MARQGGEDANDRLIREVRAGVILAFCMIPIGMAVFFVGIRFIWKNEFGPSALATVVVIAIFYYPSVFLLARRRRCQAR